MAQQRTYPRDSLQQALVVAQKVSDENAGAPMKRLLVADALGVKPGSTNFKYLLSSSRSYGLTEGTEKATDISLTPLGQKVVKGAGTERNNALRQAVLAVELFKNFLTRFDGNRLPSPDMLQKLLATDFGVAKERAEEAAGLVMENGTFVGVIRQISGSPHVLLDSVAEIGIGEEHDGDEATEDGGHGRHDPSPDLNSAATSDEAPGAGVPAERPSTPKAIFIGHGRNTGPLEKLEKILAGFQIPYKVAVAEPNLGRPIPQKVRETMLDCGSAILIFTKDQEFLDTNGTTIWRPSENVVHELGAASFAYEDRVVIFKEVGISLPTNFSSIGYIEFEENGIDAKTADLLRELIGFGLVRITPTG